MLNNYFSNNKIPNKYTTVFDRGLRLSSESGKFKLVAETMLILHQNHHKKRSSRDADTPRYSGTFN